MSAATIWILLGTLCFGVEVISMTLVLVFFGVGAWAAAAAAWLDLTFAPQVLLFITCSLLTLVLLRSRLRRVFSGQARTSRPAPEHLLIGRTGVVTKALHHGETGEISIDGSFWRAVAESDIAEGKPVRVLGHRPGDELVLRVSVAEENTQGQ